MDEQNKSTGKRFEFDMPHQLLMPNSWQLCPKCNGSGKAMNFSNAIPTTFDQCDVCNGKKIISTVTGLPPI